MDDPSNSRRPALSIDLNEAPPSPPAADLGGGDTHALVLDFLRKNAAGDESAAAAAFPGEAGVGGARECGICGRTEVRGATVVCDGCENGFHLGCLRSRQRQQAVSGDWTCGECALSGPPQKRWVLGAANLLDINEPPPREEEVENGR